MLCPKCNAEMDEVRKVDVIIDACSRCGGVWLDKGELEKLRSMSNDYYGNEHYANNEKHHDNHHYNQPHYGHRKKKKSLFDEIFDIFD